MRKRKQEAAIEKLKETDKKKEKKDIFVYFTLVSIKNFFYSG
jgi:hypothetical protein